MSQSIVTRDATGQIIVRPLRSPRAARTRRPAPTVAELGLSDPEPKTRPAGPNAEDRAAIRETEAMIRDRKNAFFGKILAPEIRSEGAIIFSDKEAPDAILLSDNGTGRGTLNRHRAAISLEAAAKASGLSEEELQGRLIGRAKLGMHEGRLMVRVSDLDKLVEAGTVPRPSEVARVAQATATAEGKPTRDQAVEDRISAMGKALGIDTSPAPKAEKNDDPASGQVFAASGRPHRRLGQPRRWGEH